MWFRTGDIGEMFEDGTVRIINRKKDLVKLPLVENICVYGDSYQSYTVAVMVPIRGALEKLATDLGKTYSDYNKLCEDNDIIQAVVKTLGIHGIKSNLEKFEIPRMMSLAPEAWTPESGLVTAAFKIKRKVIQTVFQSDIDHMYK